MRCYRSDWPCCYQPLWLSATRVNMGFVVSYSFQFTPPPPPPGSAQPDTHTTQQPRPNTSHTNQSEPPAQIPRPTLQSGPKKAPPAAAAAVSVISPEEGKKSFLRRKPDVISFPKGPTKLPDFSNVKTKVGRGPFLGQTHLYNVCNIHVLVFMMIV